MTIPFFPMKEKFALLLASLASATFLLAGCAKTSEADPSIASVAVANPNFQELEDAAIRGGLVVTLSNPNPAPGANGNFTVFAPTNAAFARLGLRTAADLEVLQPKFLVNTLLFHVANGAVPGSALTATAEPTASLLGPKRRIIRRADGTRYVNGSLILGTDVRAANGLIHPIDKVLLATGGNIVESAQALQTSQVFVQPELTFLVEAVLYTNLQGTLSSPGPFTVFAPTDQAFKDLGKALNVPLNVPADIRKLPVATVTAVLLNHAIPGSRFTPELPENATAATAGGQALRFGSFTNGVLTVQGAGNGTAVANMVIPDVQCTNGVVHVIDRVLLPQ